MANFNNNLLNYKKVTSLDNTNLEYNFEKISSKIENVIKIVFDGPFINNIETAYDPATSTGFTTNYLDTDTKYIVKQLNQSGEVTATGIALRFIAGDTEQTLYVKVLSGIFNPQYGVVFYNGKDIYGNPLTEATQVVNAFSYGSSIKEIRNALNVQKITCYYDTVGTASLHYTQDPTNPQPQYHYDYGEFPTTGIIRISKPIGNGLNSLTEGEYFTTGKILAKIVATGTVALIVELNEKLKQDDSITSEDSIDYGDSANKYYIEELQIIPCARYRIDVVETLSTSSNAIQEITFTDKTLNDANLNFEYIPTIPGESYNKVIQYKYDQTILVDGKETAVVIEANVIAWNPVTKQLYIQCITAPFTTAYGKVYQLNQNGGQPNLDSLGGNGYNLFKTDLTPKTGMFINISDDYQKSLGDFNSGTKIIQQVNELSNWYPELNYSVGEEVRQYRNGTSYITATVKSWYNPQTVAEALINPPKLVIQLPSSDTSIVTDNLLIDSQAPNFSTWASKILPSRIDVEDRSEWKFDLSQSLVLGSKVTSNLNQIKSIPEQELITKRSAGSDNILSGYYTFGAGAGPYTIAKALIKQFDKTGLANNPDIYRISLFDIKLEDGVSYEDFINYGVAIQDDSGRTIFQASPESYRTIMYKWATNPYPVGLNEINEGDILYNDSEELIGKVISIKRIDGESKLLIEREIENVITDNISGKKIKTAWKNNGTYFYVLQNEIPIEANSPLPSQGLYFINPTKEGLTRSLQNGTYFETVKSLNTTQAVEFTKCFSGSHTGSGLITLASNFETISISGLGHEILYNNGTSLIYNNSISVDKFDIKSGTLTFNPTGLGINGRYLIKVKFAAALNGFSRTKNLENNEETRTLKVRSSASSQFLEMYSFLTKSDVYSINSIKYNTTDITDYFELDPNETPEMYRFSKIKLKPSKYSDLYRLITGGSTYTVLNTAELTTFGSTSLSINYNYFEHVGDGVIVRESYSYGTNNLMELKDIEFSTHKVGNRYPHKSAVIDFRPYMSLTTTIPANQDPDSDSTKYIIKPIFCPTNKFNINNVYYANRVDNLYVNKNGTFVLEQGTPSREPAPPAPDNKKGMIIYKIAVSGYTYSLDEIKMTMVENKRYTMRDIGKLERRIQNLEYYTTLSLLEQEANALSIVDADGLTREKMGILTDSFTTHEVGDIVTEYNACMNTAEGYLTSPTKAVKLPIKEKTTKLTALISQNVVGGETLNTGLYQFAPSGTEQFIYQPLMTNAISVTGLDLAVYDGLVILDPAVDDWVDTKVKPPLRVNLDGNSEAINQMAQALFNNNISPFGTVYGDWTPIPGSYQRQDWGGRNWHRTKEDWEENRTVDKTFMKTSTSEVSLGERITDISISHYIRPQRILIHASGLRPNTRFYVFFDNVKIDEYCTYKNSTMASYLPIISTTNIAKTDSNGEVWIRFNVPSQTFRNGEKQITVTDSPKNDRGNKYTLMYASAAFASSGMSITKETTVGTVRNFEMQHTRDMQERSQTRDRTWTWDPIAQTFFVNELEYPEGLFLESIDLIFEGKDETIPVKVEIRPTVNGFPDVTKIHPGGVSIKRAQDVKVTGATTPSWSNTNHVTNFKFDYPVYLPPGEHCIVIKTNSKRYTIWAAQMGNTTVGTNPTLVTDQPELGVFFRSANATTWEPDGTIDLSFKIKKYHWQNYLNISQTVEFIPTVSSRPFDDVSYDLYQNTFESNGSNALTFDIVSHNIQAADYNSCKLKYGLTYTVKGGGGQITFQGVNKDSDIVLTKSGELNKVSDAIMYDRCKVVCTFIPTNRNVIPIFDLAKSGMTFIRNMVDTTEINGATLSLTTEVTNNESAPIPQVKSSTLNNTQPATVRYLTRTVVLDEESRARNIKVGLTAYVPDGSLVEVYVKTGNTTDNKSFDSLPYTKLTYLGNAFVSTDPNDYRAMDFELPQDIDLFNRFKVKICIYSSRSTHVPKVKDMRAFAVI